MIMLIKLLLLVKMKIISKEYNRDLPCDPDSEEEECDTCERIFKNNNELNEHQTNDNCGFECKVCGEYLHLSLPPQS